MTSRYDCSCGAVIGWPMPKDRKCPACGLEISTPNHAILDLYKPAKAS